MQAPSLTASPVVISRSKVERPLVIGQLVRRERIEARLDNALARTLTVISAPAGHGKTSTLAAWLDRRQLDAAWLTVDSRDAELTRFAAHMAAAIDRVVPGMQAALYALLTVPDRLAPHHLGEAFAETLYDLDRDVLLVLDDFHAADSELVTEFISGVLHGAPRRLHTILSIRNRPPFPLARLRVLGEVEELTGADFRFSPQETGELLFLESGEVIETADAARIQESVGGWPAAVRLIAMSRGAGGARVPVQDDGDDQDRLLLDYLGEEVLARLSASQRGALLRASLMDRFSPQLLEALATVDGEPSISRAELASMRGLELYRELPGLSDTWFAYHPLFQSTLRRELERTTSGQTIAEVRRYAAAWFAGAGYVREAVTHLVAAGRIDEASALIESRLTEAFSREDWQSVASWLRATPPEAIRQRPVLLLASAWVAYLGGRAPRIADVVSTMRDPGYCRLTTTEQQAEIALLADDGDDPIASIEIAERAIALMAPSKRYRYGYAHLALGMSLVSAGREDEALARLTAFTERESARIDAASIRGYFGRVVVLWQAGRLTRCAQIAADLLQLAAMNGLPVSAGWGALHLGAIAHEQGALSDASRHSGAVIADAERGHFLCVEEAFSLQVLVYEAQGLRDEADRAVQRLRELAISSESVSHLDHVDALIARTALIRGDLETARRWLATASPTLAQNDLKSPHNAVLTRIKILIAVGSDDALREADRQLSEFVHAARTKHMALALIEGLAVRALLHESRREHATASRVLRESLELAAPEGIVQRYGYLGPGLIPILRRLLAERAPLRHARAVLDALEGVLAAQPPAHLDEHATAPHEPTTHPLTDREIEVVRLLALRLTNHEIGEELFISPITVKHHVANISGKLGVSGRRAAVARANELHLIP